MEVALPPGLTKKHLKVQILPRSIEVSWPEVGVAKAGQVSSVQTRNSNPVCIFFGLLPGEGSRSAVRVSGRRLSLFGAVRPDESTWTLDGAKVVVSCEKSVEAQWPSLLAADEGLSL